MFFYLTLFISLAQNGHDHGAVGYLITDWGDNGHWQTLPISYLGFFVGAGLAWNAGVRDLVAFLPCSYVTTVNSSGLYAVEFLSITRELDIAAQPAGLW